MIVPFAQLRRSLLPPCSSPVDLNGQRKRKSRWGDARPELAGVSGLPTAIDVQGMSVKDLANYTISLRLDEINRKLRSGDVVPPERERYVYTTSPCTVDPLKPHSPTM